MTTKKKSLLSSLSTTKKAIVASNSTDEKPNVAAPVSARLYARTSAKVRGHVLSKVGKR